MTAPGQAPRAHGGRRFDAPATSPAGRPGQPLVSYVTVVRNAVATLPRTLASVRAQTWPQVEHVVVDGLSDDGTLGVIEAHRGQIDCYVSEADAGLYDALNKAVALARGSLICVLNADDWLTPDAAAIAAQALLRLEPDAANPGPRLLLSAAWVEYPKGPRLWLPGVLDEGSWLSCPDICHNGVYATPAAYGATGPYDTRLRVVADTRWLLAAQEAGVPVTPLRLPTVHYSVGGLSSDVSRHLREFVALLRQRFGALDEAEAWTLAHAWYPHRQALEAFRDRCPPHLGAALAALVQRHVGEPLLQRALQRMDWQRQQPHARALPLRKKPRLQRWRDSLRKRWLEARLRRQA